MESMLDAPGSANVRVTSTGNVKDDDLLHCFVCDMVITGPGRFYSLATCRAQKSKSRIIEKLGQLVGDQYMVVIAEDDIICRGCATVVNTLDRLECEMGSLRSVILRFLEKKYSLPEGELVNQKTTGMSQPPQIMPSSKQGSGNPPANSMARKRQAALQQLGISDVTDAQQENVNHLNKSSKDSSADKWIQCDKCRYTTKYSLFKHHHLRSAENECEVTTPTPDADRLVKKTTAMPSQKKAGRPPKAASMATEDASRDSDDSETVEMIAAEISDYTAGQSADVAAVEPETIKVQIVSQGQAPRKRYGEKEVTIEMPEIHEESQGSDSVEVMADDESQICVMESVEEQLMKMNEAEGGEDDNTVYVQMVEDKDEGEEEEEEEMDEQTSSKQVLAVSDDGTVEMVEVTWDEMHAADTAAQGSNTF